MFQQLLPRLALLVLCCAAGTVAEAQSALTPAEAQAIAREAYVYGFPIVEGYKTLYKQSVDTTAPSYKGPFNQIAHNRTVATPADTFVVTPNSDTPYSFAWIDLRAEPIVITLPKIEATRYYSAQLIDLQTFNFAYLGTRAFGNDGGSFLITGPGWKGERPRGVRAVIPCETQLFYALFRTQLFNPGDLDNVHRIQDGYKVQPLSAFLGMKAPAPAPAIAWPKPSEAMSESPALFSYLNFLLQYSPTDPSEVALMQRFARLNIGAGKSFDFASFPPDIQQAIEAGISEAQQKDLAGTIAKANGGAISSGDMFGTRAFLNNNYVYRYTAAKLGLYGNSRDEALYPIYLVDADGKPLDASTASYELRFAEGQFPPAGAFWSLTMYDGKSQQLVANPLKRYLLNSTMLKQFRYGADGSLTLHLARAAPGADQQANWLPAPNGPFYVVLRLYLPKPEVIDGRWRQPPLARVALK